VSIKRRGETDMIPTGRHDGATRQPRLGFLIWIKAARAFSSQIALR
jgi:hypothetical protein